MMIAVMIKEDEEAIKAILAIMIETMTMITILIIKIKITEVGDDIPTTSISPVSYMEEDTIQKNILHVRSRLANANSSHLTTISTISATIMATISPISTITSLLSTSLVCLSTTFRLLI